jgi:hypothetical protein
MPIAGTTVVMSLTAILMFFEVTLSEGSSACSS